ncbi:MAG: hypothetical protein HKL90_04625 [Elusimicrobia bacterium]|nr:hypothetical protein [Elusimicrobiota bacterium]
MLFFAGMSVGVVDGQLGLGAGGVDLGQGRHAADKMGALMSFEFIIILGERLSAAQAAGRDDPNSRRIISMRAARRRDQA